MKKSPSKSSATTAVAKLRGRGKERIVTPEYVQVESECDSGDEDDLLPTKTPTTSAHVRGTKRVLSDQEYEVTTQKRIKKSKTEEEPVKVMEEIAQDIKYENDPTSIPSPEMDESAVVTRDPKLKSSYNGLANIRAASIISWSDQTGDGQPNYSGILNGISTVNESLLYSAIVFQSYRLFANISRVDPAQISTGLNGQKFLHLCGGSRPAVFISVILVDSCNLLEAKTILNSKPMKVISGALIEGEWERFVGGIGMVIHEHEFRAQLYKDNLSFNTLPANFEVDTPQSSPTKKVYSGKASPFTRRSGTTFNTTALSCNDNVPIYDARNAEGDFIKALKNINSLPKLNSEIPGGSCAIVGYTINTFVKKRDVTKSLSFNIHWAMRISDSR